RLDVQGGAAETAIQHRIAEARAPRDWSTGPLVNQCGTDRAHRKAGRPKLERAHLEIIEADHFASGAHCECAAWADAALDREPKRGHAAVREWPVELGDRADGRRAAGTGPEADRLECQPLTRR